MKLFNWLIKHCFSKLRRQVVVVLVCVAVLPILLLALINVNETSTVFLQKNQETLEDNLHLSNMNLQNALGNYRNLMIQISTDTDYYENLSRLAAVTPDEYAYRNITQSFMDAIRSKIFAFPEVLAVGVIAENGSSYLYTQQRQKTRMATAYFESHIAYFLSQCQTLSAQIMEPVEIESQWYDENHPMFYIAVPSMHYDRMRIEGCMVLFLSPDALQSLVNRPASYLYGWSDILVVSEKGRVLLSKNHPLGSQFTDLPAYAPIAATELTATPQLIDGGLLASRADTGMFDTRLYSLADYNAFTHTLTRIWNTNLIAMAGLLAGIVFFSYLLTKQFINAVERVAHAMQQVDETHLDIQVPETSHNELRVIERSFNDMTRQIRSLLKQNRRQYERLLSLNQKACMAELKAMELQINPHFLFNTIDAINWTAVKEGNPIISDQLSRLSTTLRHTVYHVNAPVTIQAELEWIIAYLELQQIRFAGRFQYALHVQPETRPLRLHKLLLQPFLENSILHGFENIDHMGQLTVTSRVLKQTYLLLRVEDNGSGIPPAKLRSINRLFAYSEELSGVGLNNIAYRLREYYPGARVHAASGGGLTRFTLYIPLHLLKEEENAQNTDRG